MLIGRIIHQKENHGSCPVRATGGSLPCGRYLLASSSWNKERSKESMVLRVRPTPTRFQTNILNTSVDSTPWHSILNAWCQMSTRCDNAHSYACILNTCIGSCSKNKTTHTSTIFNKKRPANLLYFKGNFLNEPLTSVSNVSSGNDKRPPVSSKRTFALTATKKIPETGIPNVLIQ